MTSLAEKLARPEILALPPVDIVAHEDAFGAETIKLDANENPFAPLLEGALSAGVNRYPEPQPARLKQMMAALYGVTPENLIITRGGDDGIDLLVRTFCRAGSDTISICSPTFSVYAHAAQLQGASVVDVKLNEDFDLDVDALLTAVADVPSLKLVFLCSPNNPTGNILPPADVLRIADTLPNSIIVLDEAYIEFAEVESLAGAAAKRENLVLIRTLSKAYGLAGARVGALVGHADTIAIVLRALPAYPLPTLSIAAAQASLAPSRRPLHEERIRKLKADRDAMAPLLEASPIVRKVRNGGGNFLFLEVDEPEALAKKLQSLGIRVRFRANAAPGGLRLTVGTDSENQAALAAFGVAAPNADGRRAEIVRDTKETKIAVAVDLDKEGRRKIDTGIPFYDHMLDQVAAHGGFSLTLICEGDLEIDAHHSIEDCALAFGSALSKALGDRRGIGRFGFSLPMDETEAHVLIDLSGRPHAEFDGAFKASHLGAYPTEMTSHVFTSIATSLGAAIHVRVAGENDHHKTEACFKAFGRALRQGVVKDASGVLPSTKGVL